MINSISILFPIYNEKLRLKNSLNKIDIFISKKYFKKVEIILINDGSTDQSNELIKLFLLNSKNKKNYKLISYKKNMGKGYALAKGVNLAKNDWILTCDIDLSVELKQIITWDKKFLNKNLYAYFGSRLHKSSIVKKNFIRNMLGYIFRFFIYVIFKLNIDDTQCGFKLYKRNTAIKIFINLTIYRYTHDIEISIICLKNNIKIKELPVIWKHKSNEKVNIFVDPFIMLVSLIKIKFKLY